MCGRWFRHLGAHIVKGHGATAREYKEDYGFPLSMPLICDEMREVKREKALAVVDQSYKRNFFTKKAVAVRFKKGHSGYRRMSEFEKKKVVERINSVNGRKRTPGACPVCRAIVKHVESHLFNKHGLLKVK